MSEPVLVPGGRDVRASLDRASLDPAGSDTGSGRGPEAEACVVACPPHPQYRGHRGDARLTAVSDALNGGGVDCLRFDYGDWDGGPGELADVRNALDWADERYERVGCFGFSFGGCLTLLAAGGARPSGEVGDPPGLAVASVLAPAARVTADLDATEVMDRIDCPAQVVYGTRDDTADWEPVVDRARDLDWAVTELSADHFFVGQTGKVADAVGDFLLANLG